MDVIMYGSLDGSWFPSIQSIRSIPTPVFCNIASLGP